LYDRLLALFKMELALHGKACPIGMVKVQLRALSDIMYTLRTPPSLNVLASLFLFSSQGQNLRESADVSSDASRLIKNAERSLATVRNFNKKVPLQGLVRFAFSDPTINPKEISGGEDWFGIYRNFWQTKIKNDFDEYIIEKRKVALVESLTAFFDGKRLEDIPNVQSKENPDGLPVAGALSISFLWTFYKQVFLKELNQILRPILIDGEFYKRENRTEFAEAYNELIKLEDIIKAFVSQINEGGEFKHRYDQIIQDVQSPQVRVRKLQVLKEEINTTSQQIITTAHKSLTSAQNVLFGISSKEKGSQDGAYETLSNLAQLAGKGTQFYDGVSFVIDKIKKTIQLLDDVKKVETASVE
jgi:hypothetical protein